MCCLIGWTQKAKHLDWILAGSRRSRQIQPPCMRLSALCLVRSPSIILSQLKERNKHMVLVSRELTAICFNSVDLKRVRAHSMVCRSGRLIDQAEIPTYAAYTNIYNQRGQGVNSAPLQNKCCVNTLTLRTGVSMLLICIRSAERIIRTAEV